MDARAFELIGLLDAERQALGLGHPRRAQVTIKAFWTEPANELDDEDLGAAETPVARVTSDVQDPQPRPVCQIDRHGRGR